MKTVKVGDKTADARGAVYLLSGHNVYNHRTFWGPYDQTFNATAGVATRNMKWWLGYAAADCVEVFGEALHNYLVGIAPLTLTMRVRRYARKFGPNPHQLYQFPVTGKNWKLIGYPYQGTHGKEFNKARGTDNWESERAVDIACAVGTPLVAAQDGTIGPQFGPLGGNDPRMLGIRLHLVTHNDEFYYAHLHSTALGIKPGVKVKQGEVLGYSGAANGVAHLHIAQKVGNPLHSFFNK